MKLRAKLFVFFMLSACTLKGDLVPVYVGSNAGDCGLIVGESTDEIKDATVEQVVIYAKEHDYSDKKIKRNGIFVRYPDAIGTVLMCHGFMCNKHDQAFLRQMFPAGLYNVMSFDFRAHGDERENQVSTLGQHEAHDVTAAVQFIKNHPKIKKEVPVYAYGFSMGAVAAIEAQAKDPSLFQAMILDCPFESSENVIKRGLDHLKISIFGYIFDVPGKGLLERYAFHPYVQSWVRMVLKAVANMDTRDTSIMVSQFSPGTSVKKISIPVFFIHCKKDNRVSVDAIREIYNNIGSNYKLLWLTKGRGHFDSYFYSPEKYTERVREFLKIVADDRLNQANRREIIEDEEEKMVN